MTNLPQTSPGARDATRSMRSSFVAFAVMVVAFVVVDAVVTQSLHDSGDDGHWVDVLGAQRGRSESLAKNSLVLLGNGSAQDKERAAREFQWTLDEMTAVERSVLKAGIQQRLHDDEGQVIPSLWIPAEKSFSGLEHAAVAFQEAYKEQPLAPANRELSSEIIRQSRAFVRSMNHFVDALSYQQGASIENSSRAAISMVVMFVLTLVAQALYIFRPALRKVRASLSQVQVLQNQVEGQNGLLSERNRNLEDHRRTLERQRLELEAQNEQLQISQTRLEEQRAELARQHSDTQRQKEHLEQLASSLEAAKDLQAQAARRAEELFQGVPVACFSFDADGVLHAWNRAAEELYGFAAYEVLWRPMWDALEHGHAKEPAQESIDRVFQMNESSVSEWHFSRRDGKRLVLQTTSFPIRDGSGRVIAGIGTTLDLTERRQYEQAIEENLVRINDYSQELENQKYELQEANNQLSALASTDGLTGLTNHRTFQERLESEFEISKKFGAPLSLVLADVDHFKNLNDEHGHPMGDKVLQEIAAVLKQVAGEKGTACRYGGEEFVVILPGVSDGDALQLTEDMRAAIERCVPSGITVTASFGVASWNAGTRSRAEMIAQSDKALYMSKKAGRNCVTHARELDDLRLAG